MSTYPERQLPALSSAQTSGAAVLIEAGPETITEPACGPVQAMSAPLHGNASVTSPWISWDVETVKDSPEATATAMPSIRSVAAVSVSWPVEATSS